MTLINRKIFNKQIFSKISIELEKFEGKIRKGKLDKKTKDVIEEILLQKKMNKNEFVYGKTPYETIEKIFEPLMDEMEDLKKSNRPFLLLGSAFGAIGFYAYFHLDIPVIGYDLLSPYVDFSNDLAKKYGIEDKVKFKTEDIRDVSLNNVGIIWMDDCCWKDTSQLLNKKFVDEKLDENTIIISYNEPSVEVRQNLQLLYTKNLCTTWIEEQPFYIYRVIHRGSSIKQNKEIWKKETTGVEKKEFIWEKLKAEGGFSISQILIGRKYLDGVVVEKNRREGLKYLRCAASNYFGVAILYLALELQKENNIDEFEEAYELLKNAREIGIDRADQFLSSICLKISLVVYDKVLKKFSEKDAEEAYKWLKRAKENNCNKECVNNCLYSICTKASLSSYNKVLKKISKKDAEEAYKWLKRAKENNCNKEYVNDCLSKICLKISLVVYNKVLKKFSKKDAEEAYKWLKRAKENDNKEADQWIKNLSVLSIYSNKAFFKKTFCSFSNKKDSEIIYKWLERAKDSSKMGSPQIALQSISREIGGRFFKLSTFESIQKAIFFYKLGSYFGCEISRDKLEYLGIDEKKE